MRELGKNIRTLREGRGMTQDGFAELLYVTRQTVSNYENGRSQPDLEMLTEIARVLDTDVNTLLGAASAPVQTDAAAEAGARKRAILRLAISGTLLIALLLAMILLKRWADEQFRAFIGLPRAMMMVYYYPGVCALAGWCGMQALEVFFGVQPLQKRWCRYARWVVLVLMLSCPMCWGFFRFPIPLPDWLLLFSVKVVKQPALFAIFGMVLWALEFLHAKPKDPTA